MLGERLVRLARIGATVGNGEEDKPGRRASTISLGRSNALPTTGERQPVGVGARGQTLNRLLAAAG